MGARGGREDRATLVKSRGRVERISDAVSCPGWVGYLSRGLRASTAMVRTAPAANPGLTTARTPTLAARWATVAKGATCGRGRGKGVLSWEASSSDRAERLKDRTRARTWDHAAGDAAPRRAPGVTARRRKRPAAAREERDMDMVVLNSRVALVV